MKRLLKHKALIAVLVFFVLIIGSGFALAASGNWENPLAALTQSAQGGERGAPQEGGERPAMSERGAGEGSSSGIEISWSQLGGVLYNVWYLFAAAAAVMVISAPFSAIRKTLRTRQKTAASVPSN